ncbi:MAG: hypothetical protein GTO24_19680, partial [candidate division Zixibacteria bacterium]|nr:hypothetical protein [candidate division Zixibacteria bacterium]
IVLAAVPITFLLTACIGNQGSDVPREGESNTYVLPDPEVVTVEQGRTVTVQVDIANLPDYASTGDYTIYL